MRMKAGTLAHTERMLTLFLRAVFMYLFVFAILRLTGKRQVSDLQPFDLLITLLIADLAGCAIGDTDTPLVYSIVPILGMYLVQQAITRICLKSAPARRLVCGSPVILVRDGRLCETAMRKTSYTIIDLLDRLRAKDVFDLNAVAYAILETNGSLSVLQHAEEQPPSRAELHLPAEKSQLGYMLVLDGCYCFDAMETLGLSLDALQKELIDRGVKRAEDVFFLYRAPSGKYTMQLKERCERAEGSKA